jgi:hypothetical protein
MRLVRRRRFAAGDYVAYYSSGPSHPRVIGVGRGVCDMAMEAGTIMTMMMIVFVLVDDGIPNFARITTRFDVQCTIFIIAVRPFL